MNIQVEKLELVQLLLNTENEDALKKVKDILKKYAAKSSTEYLLSTKANTGHLLKGIDDLKKGKGKAIKTSDLWK
jgi:hypothetical protein